MIILGLITHLLSLESTTECHFGAIYSMLEPAITLELSRRPATHYPPITLPSAVLLHYHQKPSSKQRCIRTHHSEKCASHNNNGGEQLTCATNVVASDVCRSPLWRLPMRSVVSPSLSSLAPLASLTPHASSSSARHDCGLRAIEERTRLWTGSGRKMGCGL